MSTVRRLYFYALALISAEVVIWGVIRLLRAVVSSGFVGEGSLLATALSLVLVGTPIFLLHWRVVQRDALADAEERANRIRAFFLYAALFVTLLPILYAVLALLDRGLVVVLGQAPSAAWFGGDGTATDNLIAIVINAVALVYFWTILRADWLADIFESFLLDTRRLYRYLWMLFGLTLTVSGVYNLLRYILFTPGLNTQQTAPVLAGGISLLFVGVPLWAYFWQAVQRALSQTFERRSLLRLVVLYLISFAGVIGVLAAGGRVINALLRWILGEPNTLLTFLQNSSAELGALIPLAVMWGYYGRILDREVAAMPDQPRREALRRLYDYILALLGLAVTFSGLLSLVGFLAELAFAAQSMLGTFRDQLSSSLAALLIGIPLWLVNWRAMQAEAARRDDTGDHARRSVLRKAYLYLLLFLLVIGAMTFTGQLLYALLNTLFSRVSENLALDVTRFFLSLVIDAALLVYHWRALREDNLIAQETLGNLHRDYPTLILVEGEAPYTQVFADAVVQALARFAPRLPVAVHSTERGAPDETLLGAKAVLLPVGLVLDPPESLRLWLQEYHGRRILIPAPKENWLWLGLGEKRAVDVGREAAQSLRQLAEGEAVRGSLPSNPWAVAGYILGGIFGLILLITLFSVMVSGLFQ